MEDIDAELLITLVHARPVLWDKYLDTYKDRNATKNSWREVCMELLPGYDGLEAKDQDAFGKEVLRRWTNVRDSFLKYRKKVRMNRRSGIRGAKFKKYVYSDHLQFLCKIYDEEEFGERSIGEYSSNEGESMGLHLQASARVMSVATPELVKPTRILKSRKFKQSNVDKLLTNKSVEGDKICSKMAFLRSLMPHLQKFDDSEFLQFQMGVLGVIANIKEKQNAITPHTSHFSHHQFPTDPQPLLLHPSAPTHCQSQGFLDDPNRSPHNIQAKKRKIHAQTPSTYPQVPVTNQSQSSTFEDNPPYLKLEIESLSSAGSPVSHEFSEFVSPDCEERCLSAASSMEDIETKIIP